MWLKNKSEKTTKVIGNSQSLKCFKLKNNFQSWLNPCLLEWCDAIENMSGGGRRPLSFASCCLLFANSKTSQKTVQKLLKVIVIDELKNRIKFSSSFTHYSSSFFCSWVFSVLEQLAICLLPWIFIKTYITIVDLEFFYVFYKFLINQIAINFKIIEINRWLIFKHQK